MARRKLLYQWQKAAPGEYRQKVLHDGVVMTNVNGQALSYPVRKGQVSGVFRTSKQPDIFKQQLNDMKQSNLGNLQQNAWIDSKSSVEGNFKLPLDAIFVNSNIKSDSKDPSLINRSVLKDTNAYAAPNNHMLIADSILNKCKLISQMNNPKKSKQQMSFINKSRLNNSVFNTKDGTLYVSDSMLKGIRSSDSLSITNSNIKADKEFAVNNSMLDNVHGHIKQFKHIKNANMSQQKLADTPAKQQANETEFEL